jgi:proteasome maturation protein
VAVADSYAAPDALSGGLRSVRHEVAAAHPAETVQKHWQGTQDQLQAALQSLAFGSHMPMRHAMERAIVGQHARMPVLPSSRVGLDILAGRDETLEVEDYLADPELAAVRLDPHSAMEHKLHMVPGRH